MTALVINMGPVYGPNAGAPSTGDIGDVAWQGEPPDILTISGNGSSHFSDLASSWMSNGHILPQLLAHYGRRAEDYDAIALTGFSAGHGLAAPLLLLDGDSISAAVMFDACFSLRTQPKGKDGYASFGARAARGEKLLVLTSSHGQNGPGLLPSWTGSECALDSFDRAVADTGATPQIVPPPPGIPTSNPKGNFYGDGSLTVEQAGQFVVLDYGPLYYHGDHINLLSRDVLSTYLAPYLATGRVPAIGALETGAPSGDSSSLGLILGAAAVALVAVIAIRRTT